MSDVDRHTVVTYYSTKNFKGVFGRGEKGKREIKTRKPMHNPNICIGFRVLISLFPFSPLPSKG
jgi:hypothetical protein